MLCTIGKIIRKTMLLKLKMPLSLFTAVLCRGTLLQIENFWKTFIVYYRKVYAYIQALSTYSFLNIKARKLKSQNIRKKQIFKKIK